MIVFKFIFGGCLVLFLKNNYVRNTKRNFFFGYLGFIRLAFFFSNSAYELVSYLKKTMWMGPEMTSTLNVP